MQNQIVYKDYIVVTTELLASCLGIDTKINPFVIETQLVRCSSMLDTREQLFISLEQYFDLKKLENCIKSMYDAVEELKVPYYY